MTSAPLKRSCDAQKPESKSCNCVYCGLKGGSDRKLSLSAVKKPSSMIDNPKYKPKSGPTGVCTTSTIGNGESAYQQILPSGSVTIKKTAPTEKDSKRIDVKSDTNNSTPSVKEERPDVSLLRTPVHKCECGNSYSVEDHLRRHVKFCEIVKANKLNSSTVASDSSKIKCECGMGFDCVYNLVRHKEENCTGHKPAGKTFKCECRLVFDDYDGLLKHRKTVCRKREQVADPASKSVGRVGKFRCECGLSYANHYTLLKHRDSACVLSMASTKVEKQQLSQSCECGRKFARTSDLSRHRTVCELQGASGSESDSDVEVKQEDNDEGLDSNHSRAPYGKRVARTGTNSKPKGTLSCRCGKSYTSYSALLAHHNDPCPAKDSEIGGVSCVCNREFTRLNSLSNHVKACVLARKILVDPAQKGKGHVRRCDCGAIFATPHGLLRHKKGSCSLRKRVVPSLSKSSSKIGQELKGSRVKPAANRCKCGAQFSIRGNLNRHIRMTCSLYKRKAISSGERRPRQPSGSKKVDIRGSRVVNSKKWGNVRGPPFVCECGAYYTNYGSLGFHKRNICKIGDDNPTGGSSKSRKKQASGSAREDASNPQLELERVDFPDVDSVFDLSTAVKFKCVCGKEFYSKFSLNGHTTHCKGYLAMKRATERCSFCKASFPNRAQMLRHVKYTHSDVSNAKIVAKVKKNIAKSPKSRPNGHGRGPVIGDVMSLADPS